MDKAELAQVRSAIVRRKYKLAKDLIDSCLEKDLDDVDALCLGALVYWRGSFDVEWSASMLQRARELAPENARVLTLSAELDMHFGRIVNACGYARTALAIDDKNTTAYVVLARASASSVAPSTLEKMIRLAASSDLGRQRRRNLLNAIGRVYDARADYDKAFDYFSQSNELAEGRYDRERREAVLAEAHAMFDAKFAEDRASFGLRDKGAIFIIGMPRSGSTLLEQAFSAHPDVDSCGESDAVSVINRALYKKASAKVPPVGGYFHLPLLSPSAIQASAQAYLARTAASLRKPDRTHQVDKRLSNFLHVPLIRMMFPDARFLHTHRHPLDVSLSCYMQDFDEHYYTNNLADLAHFYDIYLQYMKLWSQFYGDAIRHCSYERLVSSLASETRIALNFVGLEWHHACVQPHKVERFVMTSSAAQVRAPVHDRAIGRWRNYKKHLKPLIDGLGGHDEIEKIYRFWIGWP